MEAKGRDKQLMMTASFPSSFPPPIALVGPTASGKSALSLALAQRYSLEIISVDSALVYRGMNIGTAKPTAAELAQVPHHLIDIRDPSEPYSTAEFVADAERLIQDIQARGKRVLLVGGTMLYLKALLHGLDDLPPAQPALRLAIETEARAQGWPALHTELAQVDPLTAARLSPNDSQRIGRALEVYRATGQPLSSFHSGKVLQAQPTRAWPILSLEPTQRAWLHERIALRFEQMLTHGLIAEVLALRHRTAGLPVLHAEMPALRCVGYRQVWDVLSEYHLLDDTSLLNRELLTLKLKALDPKIYQKIIADIQFKGIAATRQLAKRQLTWLRSTPERTVIACDQDDVWQQVHAQVQKHWG
ncbi:MAG: tRNA dimethylallyltransferase [Pseudomonadota bacterium]|jgi:tRNA dimethylallyltransferase